MISSDGEIKSLIFSPVWLGLFGITLPSLTKLWETLTCDFDIGSGDSSLH
jgi:hypothetical protein